MERGRSGKIALQPAEPEVVRQDAAGQEPGTPVDAHRVAPKPAVKRESISKAEGVRRALAEGLNELGDIEGLLKHQYGIEMPRQQISVYKSQTEVKERKGEGGKSKGKPARSPKAPTNAVEGYLASPAKLRTSQVELDLVVALEAITPLVAALGAEKVKRIADLLG